VIQLLEDLQILEQAQLLQILMDRKNIKQKLVKIPVLEQTQFL